MPDCTPQLRTFFFLSLCSKNSITIHHAFILSGQVVDCWIQEEFHRQTGAKCLILIGPTGTGKRTFAKSLPGPYNHFRGRWHIKNWNDHVRYLIFDDIDWDQYGSLGFPSKKDLFTQQAPINVR